ncbi:MAG TPA: hypothetical protein VL334_21295 [Anaerolineae bacterium]|nr:hypothetical protein [Anaerolineae bacterium]
MTAADPSITWPAPFWPDEPPPADTLWPSERHPWSNQMVEHTLRQLSQPGDWVLDPFASQAALVRAASAERRRLVLNNASQAALLGVLASAAPPPTSVVDHAFSRIADAPRRGRTLAHHLAALYETICPECAQTIVAARFVWDRTVGEPVEKSYHCPHCAREGDAPVDMVDVARVAALEVRGAAYWGLLSRLVKPGDALTAQARSLQDLYPPRALLVISELLTAAEQRLNDSEELHAARAMILHVLVAGLVSIKAGASHAVARPQPPRRFVENNLWLAFEHAHRTLRSRPHGKPPLLVAAEMARLRAPEGEGRVLPSMLPTPELAEQLGSGSVALILTEPPPFDPTSYALQFLWSGWLYGREAANHQRMALSIEQWSWDWYTRAMSTALRTLRTLLPANGRLVMALADRSPRRGLALLAAASVAGWRLAAQATQTPLNEAEGRTQWRFELMPAPSSPQGASANLVDRFGRSAHEATQQLFEARGEPVPPALVQTACAVRWSELGLLAELALHPEAARQPMSFLLAQMRLALNRDLPPPGLLFMPTDPANPDSGGLWAAEHPLPQPPLADRLEQFIVQQLEAGPVAAETLSAAAYAAFPGWQTPDAALLAACLASYGQPDGEHLRLRAEDQPAQRRDDLADILRLLVSLGQRLGYEVWLAAEAAQLVPNLPPASEHDRIGLGDWAPANVVWHTQGEPAFAFAVVAQASLHPWLAAPSEALAACPRYVALPGGRAGLLDFKLRRCPPWRTRLAWTGWEFVKFRHLRELASQTGLSLASFRARIGLDPIVTLPGQQLALFEMENEGDPDDA